MLVVLDRRRGCDTIALAMKRATLLGDLCRQFADSRTAIKSISSTNEFISFACREACLGDGLALFSRLRSAGELLPSSLDSIRGLQSLERPDARVPNFLQMQLFVALVATLEGLLTEMATLVLLAFPAKIETLPTRESIVGASSLSAVREIMVEAELNKIFYAKPAEYRRRIEAIISADSVKKSQVFDLFWDAFVEHKASRDIGLHNGWRSSDVYVRKAGNRARRPDADGYIYPDDEYFTEVSKNALDMVNALEVHCAEVFKSCRPSLVFHDMWRCSALAVRVPFESVWEHYGDGCITTVPHFRHGWSGGEKLVFDFFLYVFNRDSPPDFVEIRRRWAGTKTGAVVDEWLEAPFFL